MTNHAEAAHKHRQMLRMKSRGISSRVIAESLSYTNENVVNTTLHLVRRRLGVATCFGHVRTSTKTAGILRAVESGCETSKQIVAATGYGVSSVSARLTSLAKRRLIEFAGFAEPVRAGRGTSVGYRWRAIQAVRGKRSEN
jgi:DNA-binding CsgD family transcriptional regulator